MSDSMIAALVYADGVYPDEAIGRAIEPLRERGVPLAGAIQRDPADRPGRHPCDLLLENLPHDVGLTVLKREGDVRIVVVK